MMLPLKDIFSKYSIYPTGVLHIGASEGQERDFYNGPPRDASLEDFDPQLISTNCRPTAKGRIMNSRLSA